MSTKRKPADILPRLLEWQQIYDDWMAQYEALQTLTKCGPEAPIALAMGRMWENDMGTKGLPVTKTSGKTIKVRTVAHLARVICY